MYCATIETIFTGPLDGLENIEPVTLQFEVNTVLVRELIQEAVKTQVQHINSSASKSLENNHKRIRRQYLSEQDVTELAEQGRIILNDTREYQLVDTDTCVSAALEGFSRRRFFIAVNGVRPLTLDDRVVLLANTEVQFVRLVPLIGG